MKVPRPPYTKQTSDDANGNAQFSYYCAQCSKYCPATAFYKSALAKKARKCKRHWQGGAYKRRMTSPLGRMLLSLRARLHAAGEPELARAWEIRDIEAVLRRFGHREPYDKLCIVGIKGAVPRNPDEARPMLSSMARGRHHLPATPSSKTAC